MKKITRVLMFLVVLLTSTGISLNAQTYCENLGQTNSDNTRGADNVVFNVEGAITSVDVKVNNSPIIQAGNLFSGVRNTTPVDFYIDKNVKIELKKGSASFNWIHFVGYADWNGDKIFDSQTEKIFFDGTNQNADRTYNILVPSDAVTGQTRVRIIMGWLTQDTDPSNEAYYSPCKITGQPAGNDTPKNARVFDFLINIQQTEYNQDRTINVISEDESKGSAIITETGNSSITTKKKLVSVTATPKTGYFFEKWINTDTGVDVSTDNPFVYSGENDINLTATFIDGYYAEMSRYYTATNPAEQQANRYIIGASYSVGGLETEIVSEITANPNPLPSTTAPNEVVDGAVIDYTSNKIELITGTSSFDLKLKGNPGGNGLQWTQQNVFIDWNNDFDFTDADEVGTPTGTMPNNALNSTDGFTRTISIPANKAVDGATYRMRVVYNEENGNWSSTIWNNNLIRNGIAYDFEIKFFVPPTRTITVMSKDDAKGTVSIDGTTEKTITNNVAVNVNATPTMAYEFLNWVNAADNSEVSTANPFTYTQDEDINLVANFMLKKPTLSVESNTTIVKNDSVTINSVAGSTIKYTTDNTDPRTSPTAIAVENNEVKVEIVKTNTLRAVSVMNGEMSDELTTNLFVLDIKLGDLYQIKFERAAGEDIAISYEGEDAVLKTQAYTLGMETQLWKVEKGSQDGLYKIVNNNGSYIYYADRFKASSTVPTTETDMRFIMTPNNNYNGWEIQRAESSNMAMNPFGGSTVDKEIGEWYVGDGGNVINFVSSRTELEKKIKEAKTIIDNVKSKTEFGGYPDGNRLVLILVANASQFVLDDTSSDNTDILNQYMHLDSAINTFLASQINDLELLISPSNNTFKWFTIRSASNHDYIKGKVISSNGRNIGEKFTYENKAETPTDEQLFRFEISEGNVVNIINKATGVYMAQNGAMVSTAEENNGTFNLIALEDGISFNIVPSTVNALHGQESGTQIVNWSGGVGSASAWILDFVMNETTTDLSNINNSYNITISNGKVEIDGIKKFDIYSISGQKLNPNNRLEKGAYILKTDEFTQKIIIK